MGGVYVGPYTATINGVSTPVICDDFMDDTHVGESWNANVSTFPSLSNVHFEQGQSDQTKLYDEAAWLILQMTAPANASNPSTVGNIQYAIWAIFDPSALNQISGSDLTNAQGWLSQAQAQTFTSGEFSNFAVYTPTPSTPPQEFITYSTPEPSVALILCANLLLFGLAAVFLRRRGMLLVSD
ncbi:MAG: hypothetical protein ACRD18_03225 [Terriglobia bacterium]